MENTDVRQSWIQIASDWPQKGRIWDFFKISFQYILSRRAKIGSVRPNVLKAELKKSVICPIWGQSDPFEANSDEFSNKSLITTVPCLDSILHHSVNLEII